MTQQITVDQFKRICPNAKDAAKWVDALNTILPTYGINTKNRVAMFIAQCAHESGGFTALIENLNYSQEGLRKVFSKYFPTDALAAQYARNPQRIANRVYANRMGNGDEQSGDGWKFRGRGILQNTGKSQYTLISKFIFNDESVLINNPDLLLDPVNAIKAACWFWERNGLNALCDKDDVTTVSKRINGGANGLSDRVKKYELAKKIF